MMMNWISLEEVDSTSLEVDRRRGEITAQKPLCVFATHQTAGRGQQGRTWESPSGNIHLSIGLRGTWSPEMLRLLPLQVSLRVCEVLWREFSVRPTIKWPNDLLFAGAKFGGILCESRFQDNEVSIIIGIGLNCNQTPHNNDVRYRTHSLSKILGHEVHPEDLARKIADHILATPFASKFSLFQKDYETLALHAGHLLSLPDSREELARIYGYDQDGALLIERPHNQIESQYSASQSWQWSFQDKHPPSYVLADLGNSYIKLRYAHGQNLMNTSLSLPVADLTTLDNKKRLEEFLEQTVCPENVIYVASVNSPGLAGLQTLLPSSWHLQVLSKRPVRLRSQYALHEMGIDRLLGIEAVLARSEWHHKTRLIISLGTAITVDLIDKQGKHCGGKIIAGPAIMGRALNDYTSQLPLITPTQPDLVWGQKTSEAIQAGMNALVRGVVCHEQMLLREYDEKDLVTIMTGGYMHQYHDLPDTIWEKDLNFEGMIQMLWAGA